MPTNKSNFNYERNKLPMSESEKQAVALNNLMRLRSQMAQETGNWPSDEEVMKRMKKGNK
jgi:DNA-directed RNA polymerase sigma subunit (sigma70/sigma32)